MVKRWSVDCKATVKIGDFSRGGQTRGDDQALGDFLKSFYLFKLWKPVGSKCRTGAISDRAPIGPPPPPWPSCSTSRPFGKLGDSAPPLDATLSRSCFWPTPASSWHRSVSFHSSVAPRCPSSAQLDCTCYDRADNTTAGWACRSHRQTRPCDTETGFAYHYSLDHYPF